MLPSVSLRGPDTVFILDNILATDDGSIVHIRSDADATHSAEFVYRYLRAHSSTSVNIIRFNFNSHDIRFNNITSLLRTWLCQLAFCAMKSSTWPIQRMLSYMRALQAWTGEDLVQFWFRFIMDASTDNTIYVVGGLEQCDNSRALFISSLKRILTERETRLRMVITTTKGHDVDTREQLQASIPSDMYEELLVDNHCYSTENQEELPVQLSVLFQQQARYVSAGLEQRISDIFGSSRLDGDLRNVLMTWFSCDHIPIDIVESHVSSLTTPTPELVFECILSDMPMERQNWARQIIFWVLQSVRALRTEEFWVISRTILNDGANDSTQSLLRWFGGLLLIEYDEVQLGHPRLRAWLKSGHARLYSCPWWRYESKQEGNFDVLKTCLSYLRASEKHLYPLVPPGVHGFTYAVQYWHLHCEAMHVEHEGLATSGLRLALEFLADTTAFQSWIEAYISMTDQLTAPDPSSKRPFPIASHLGLYEVINVLETESPEDLTDALIEATRKGHLEIVRHLVRLCPKQFRLSEPKLEKLIKAAASCGNDEVLEEILVLFPRHNLDSEAKPTWISDMLHKSCWLGNEQLLDILLELGADPRTPMQFTDGVRPLHLAIQTNKIGVIKVLLERDTSLCVDDPILVDIVGYWASQEVAELLLASGFKSEEKSETGLTALQTACSIGRPMIADLLLTRIPNSIDYIDPGSTHPFIYTVWNQNIRTTKVLLAHGIDVNTVTSDSDEDNALFYAIEDGRLDICQLLVEHEIDINHTSKGSKPLIIKALSCSSKVRLRIVKLLLDNGADPERTEGVGPGVWGRTALLIASAIESEDAPEIIKVLLEHPVDKTVKDSEGWTPAFTAAYFGNVDSLRLLIDAEADLYATCDGREWNVLQAAYDKPEALRLLLDRGMDPFEKYEAYFSTLQLAARNNKSSCVKAMLELSGEQKESAMSDALHDAVIKSCPEVVRLLLDQGADVDRTHNMRTLLSLALEQGNEDIIRMLLEFRPQLDHESLGEKTLLHFITANTTLSTLKLLVNAGAKLDGLDSDKESPLSWAVYRENIEAVRYLLTKPAAHLTVNICGRYGAPLHQACRFTSLEMVRTLVENGADVNLLDKDLGGKAPITYACMRRGDNFAPEKQEMVSYLLEEAGAVATGDEYAISPIHIASLVCSVDLVKLLIQRGADAEQRDHIGRKPVHFASYNSLVALGALNPSDQVFAARDKLGRVPLHFAVLSGQLDLLKNVLERSKMAGINIEVRDNDGWTPLLWAARGICVYKWDLEQRDVRADEVIRFLLDNGADPGARGNVRRDFDDAQNQQWSASDIAAYHDLPDLANLLEEADPSASENSNDRPKRKIGEHASNSYCDGCYLVSSYSRNYRVANVYIQDGHGTYFVCEECISFDLCFKCYRSKEAIHAHYGFETRIAERDGEEEEQHSRIIEVPLVVSDQHEVHQSVDSLDDEVVSNDEE